MSSEKPGRLQLKLIDAAGDPIDEKVDVYLYHQTMSERVAARDVLAARPIMITGLRANPQGLYRLFVDPPSYLPVSQFVNVSASGVTSRTLPFAIDPDKVIRVEFPSWDNVSYAHKLLEASGQVLGFQNRSGQELYESLDDIRRAGLLNILAKTRRTPLTGAGIVSEWIRELRELRGDRFFAVVSQTLREHVKNSVDAGLFREASGALHRPPEGFSSAGSYKTLDHYGNLQLTFFASGNDWLADIDIDDAAGLEHVFQVVRNSVTGRPTHPYSIRDILVRFQEIDPGYRFILREERPKRRAAGGSEA